MVHVLLWMLMLLRYHRLYVLSKLIETRDGSVIAMAGYSAFVLDWILDTHLVVWIYDKSLILNMISGRIPNIWPETGRMQDILKPVYDVWFFWFLDVWPVYSK